MANFTAALNEYVRRLARRELTAQTRTVRRLTSQHRRDLAALKRQVAALARTVDFLSAQEKRRVAEAPAAPQRVEGMRFRADGLRSHRKRLGLSAKEYGQLVGVTGQSIYDWEAGASRPRPAQVARIVALRGLGKREAARRLELLK